MYNCCSLIHEGTHAVYIYASITCTPLPEYTHTHTHTHQHHHTVQVAKRTHVFVNGIYHFPAAIANVAIALLSLVGLVVAVVVVVVRRETEGGS